MPESNPLPETEQRRLERFADNFFLRCSPAGEEEDEPKVVGIVRDINTLGLAFLTGQNYLPGDCLEIYLELTGVQRPAGEGGGLLNCAAVVTQAKVVRTEILEPGLSLVAVTFNHLDPEDRRLISLAIELSRRQK